MYINIAHYGYKEMSQIYDFSDNNFLVYLSN